MYIKYNYFKRILTRSALSPHSLTYMIPVSYNVASFIFIPILMKYKFWSVLNEYLASGSFPPKPEWKLWNPAVSCFQTPGVTKYFPILSILHSLLWQLTYTLQGRSCYYSRYCLMKMYCKVRNLGERTVGILFSMCRYLSNVLKNHCVLS